MGLRKIFCRKTYLALSLGAFFVVWCFVVDTAFSAEYGTSDGESPGSRAAPGGERAGDDRVYLYFIAPDGRYLTSEIRSIEHSGDSLVFLRGLVEALISGPGSSPGGSRLPVLAPDTRVLGVYIDDAETAYVDLAKQAADACPGGVRQELLSVYAIVNTLIVNIDGIKRVKILLGGNEAETFAGHIDIGDPVNANMLLVR